MGFIMKHFHYIACVTGNAQGDNGHRIFRRSFSGYENVHTAVEAMAAGRAAAEGGGWNRIVAEDMFETSTTEH